MLMLIYAAPAAVMLMRTLILVLVILILRLMRMLTLTLTLVLVMFTCVSFLPSTPSLPLFSSFHIFSSGRLPFRSS